MSDTGEPSSKKQKTSGESDSFLPFTDTTRYHDRVLKVKTTKFYIECEVLIEHSEFFRALLTSDFREKNQKEIELKEVDPDQMIQFLQALYQPSETNISEINLEALVKLSTYFQANDYFIKLFDEKKILEHFKRIVILRLAVKHQFLELKDYIEKALLSQFADRIANKRPNSRKTSFDEVLMVDLNLASKYELSAFKDAIDVHLTTEYTTSRHILADEEQYAICIGKHELPKLKEAVELYAISRIYPGCSISQLFSCYLQSSRNTMTKFKEAIETYQISTLKKKITSKDKDNFSIQFYISHLAESETFEFHKVKKFIEECMIEDLTQTKSIVFSSWNIVVNYYLEKNKVAKSGAGKKKVSNSEIRKKEFTLLDLTELLRCANHYDLNKFKKIFEDFVLDNLVDSGIFYMEFISDVVDFGKFGLNNIKDKIKDFLNNKFEEEKHTLVLSEYEEYFAKCDAYSFLSLKERISDFLSEEYQKGKRQQTELSRMQFLKLASAYHLQTVQELVDNRFHKKFVKNQEKYWNEVMEIVGNHSMPKLEKSLEDYMLNKMKNMEVASGRIESYCAYAWRARNDQLKKTIEEYLIAEFRSSKEFHHLELAFEHNMQNFKTFVAETLETVNLDDKILVKAKGTILSLPSEIQLFLFHAMLR